MYRGFECSGPCVPDGACPLGESQAKNRRNQRTAAAAEKDLWVRRAWIYGIRLLRLVVGAVALILFLTVVEFVAEETNAPALCHPAVWFQTANDWVAFPFFRGLGRAWVYLCDIFELLQRVCEFLGRWIPIRRFLAALEKVANAIANVVLSPAIGLWDGIMAAYDAVDDSFKFPTLLVQIASLVCAGLSADWLVQKRRDEKKKKKTL